MRLVRLGTVAFALTLMAQVALFSSPSPPIGAMPVIVPATVSASNWTAVTAPPASTTTDNYAYGVSCVNADFCLSAGYVDSNPPYAAFVQTWNGTAWATQSVPNLGTSNYFNGASCVTTTFCVAVGVQSESGYYVPLIETWNGSTMAVATIPAPPAATSNLLDGVSCTSVSFCAAVGSSGDDPFVMTWNGSSWTSTTLPLPSGATETNLQSVSCSTPALCMAVGYQYDAAGTGTLAEMWNGSTWKLSGSVNTSSFDTNFLYSVSCTGLSYCTAAGFAYNSGTPSTAITLIETWNGATWQLVPSPNTTGGGGNYLYDISCFSATSCTAVGSAYTDSSSTTYVSEALTWNGQTWSLATTPNPGSAPYYVQFLGVDCLTDWACMTVGDAYNGTADIPFNAMASIARSGYRFVASDGGIFNYGTGAPYLGSMGGSPLNAPIVGMATMPAGDGYYLVAADGGVFNFGSAQFYGSAGNIHLNKPIVGMAVTADGGGYWLVASDGGIFGYGDAQFYGSMGGQPLNKPIVGMATAPNGYGYYEVASDGGIFAFPTKGGPPFLGSTGNIVLNKPVVGMAVNPAGQYYMVASDGGIFAYPSSGPNPAPFYGSTGNLALNKPIVGMALVNGGYYLGASDGGIFAFPPVAGPPFLGSRGGQPLNAPIVGISG